MEGASKERGKTGRNRVERWETGRNREEQGGNREGAAVAKFETRIPQSSSLQQFPDLSSPSSLLDQEIVLMLRGQLQNSADEEKISQSLSLHQFRHLTYLSEPGKFTGASQSLQNS